MDYDYYHPLPPPPPAPVVVAVEEPKVGVQVYQTYIPLPTNNMNLPSLRPSVNPDIQISSLLVIQVDSSAIPFSGNQQIQDVGISSINQPSIVGVQPNPTHAGNTPIYAGSDTIAQSVSQWSLYPAVSVVFASTISTNIIQTNNISANTAFVSSITNNHVSSLITDTGTINTTYIDIDGQILTADNDQLFLNGLPVATTANISSIADWALYDAVSTIRMNNNNIQDCQSIQTQSLSGNFIQTNYAQVSTIGGVYGSFNEVDVSTIQFNTSVAVGELTVDATATTLFFNGVPITTGTPIPGSNWSQYPATQTVDMASNGLSNVGSFTMPPSITNSFNLGGGTIFSPINQNKQYSLTTNIVSSSPITPLEITGSGGMSITAGSISGGQEFNITLLGVSGNDLNITAPDINLTMTDPASFMNLTAPGGIALLGGGGFFMASGVFEVITGLDCSLITAGNIRIGSGNVLGATTQIEKWEFNDGDVSAMNGVQYLNMSKTRKITNEITSDGGDGRQIFESVSQQSNIVSNFTTNSKKTQFVIDANARGINMGNYGSNVSDQFTLNLQNLSNSLSLSYLNGNTLTFGSTGGNVQLNGVATINATSALSAPTVSGTNGNFLNANISSLTTFNVNLQTASISSLTVSSINANSIIASTIATPYFNVDGDSVSIGYGTGTTAINNSVNVGVFAGNTGQLANTVSVGAFAGQLNQQINAIAIGNGAGRDGQNEYAIAIGRNAGYQNQGRNSIHIGSVSIGVSDQPIGQSCIVLNASGSDNGSPYNQFGCYINPIRQPLSKAGFFTMGYNSNTHELGYTTQIGLDGLSTSVGNVRQISYNEGLLTTSIDGLLQVNGQAEFTQNVNIDTTLNVLQTANISSLKLYGIPGTVAPNALFYNSTTTQVSYAPLTTIVAQPAFVYYVATNGRAGGSGAITDPLATISQALAKSASTGGGRPGMTIYVAPGAYSEDVVINISATLPAVSIIGMADDNSSSKRVQITGSFTINGTDATFTNTIDTVVLNNILVNAKDATTSAVSITGAGIRVYLKNGLYTNATASTVPLISLSSTGVLPSTVAQLAIDDCSITMDSASASGHLISVASGQLFNIGYSDLTHKGTGSAINITGGTFSSTNNSSFNSKGNVLNLAFSVAGLVSLTNCLVAGSASPTVALIQCGTNANLNLTDSTVQNVNTTEANNTSRYVYLTAGVLVLAIRNNFSSSASPAITQLTPFQSTTPASSILFYFANIYTNATNTIRVNLPVWVAVQQFSNDVLIPQFQVVATSATAIALNASLRGKTIILTGTTTQPFTTTGLTATDAGLAVIVHNGNATGGGDINISGATGTTIVHNRTATQNGGVLYLYWTGSALVGY